MRKILVIAMVAVMGITLTAGARVSEQSRRMQGMNPELIGVTADEYSDFMAVNTANILNIDGIRVYSQLSNLGSTGNDTAIDGVTVDNDMLLGGVGPLMDMGNMGSFLWANRLNEEAEINNVTVTVGNVDAGQGLTADAGTGEEGEYEEEDIDDDNETLEITEGDAYNNQSDIDFNALIGLDNMAFGDLGLRIGYNKNVTADIERNYEYSYDTDSDDDYATQEYSAIEQNYQSVITIAPSVSGLELMDADIGATLELGLVKNVDSTEIDADMTQGSSFTGGVGVIGVTDDYARTYERDDNEELTGTRIGLNVDGSYPLNRTMNVKGYLGFFTQGLSGDKTESWTDEVTEHSEGAIDEKVTFEQVTDRELNTSGISTMIGLEKEVNEDLLLSAGLGYMRNVREDIEDENRSVTDTDGTETYSGQVDKLTTTDIDSSIILPIGMEWTANNWLKARIGASYKVNYQTREIETVTSHYDGTDEDSEVDREVTVVESDNADPKGDEVQFYSGVGFQVTDNLVVDVTGLSDTGAVAVNQSILDLSSWELSATLKF